MNDDSTSQPDLEGHLATLLRSRAEEIDVHPDLDAVTSATTVETVPAHRAGRAWWLAAAAALIVVGGVGLRQLTLDRDGALSTGPASPVGGNGEPEASADTTVLLVWIEPDATPAGVEEMAGLLIGSPAVLDMGVRDGGGTVRDLDDFFADGPNGVELIDPGNIPAAFRVATDEPGDVGQLVTDLPALDGVENTE